MPPEDLHNILYGIDIEERLCDDCLNGKYGEGRETLDGEETEEE